VRLDGDAGVILPAIEDIGGVEAYGGERTVPPVLLDVAPVEV